MQRRSIFIGAASAAAVLAAGGGGLALWMQDGKGAWQDTVKAIRRPLDATATGPAARRELVRFATLAANSHNTQPWQFTLADNAITIAPDLARRTPVVDPDDHHLFVSLGAATENIVQTAPLLGLVATPTFDAASGRVTIALDATPKASSPLADAIPLRQCSRSIYDGRPLPAADLAALAATAGDGVSLLMLTDRPAIDAVGALIIDGDTAQMTDPVYLAELKHWLRFSYSSALQSGDGLFSGVSGNPVLPDILGQTLFPLVATAASENQKYLSQIASSSGLAIFVSDQDDSTNWLSAGRAYQRFALQATALGIQNAFLNQAVEAAPVRARLAEHLALGARRADLIVRFGHGPQMPWSMRRPVEAVSVA